MRFFIFSILFSCLFATVAVAQDNLPASQLIKGAVYREGSNEPIADASVYYDGSTSATVTDKAGKFELSARVLQIPVVVSCAGHYSVTATYQPGRPLIVYLKPKTPEPAAIAATADKNSKGPKNGMERKDEVTLFLKEFIGQSPFAGGCVVTNIDDIELFYDRKTKTLTAGCAKPIVIENKALGYTVNYFLDKFEKTPEHLTFTGNYLFKDNLITIPDSIRQNREQAYIGSRMQFIRNLWGGTLSAVGYKVYTSKNTRVNERELFASDSLQQKYLLTTKGVFIANNYVQSLVNMLSVNQKHIYIDRNGYCGPGLEWTGGMGEQRVADLLPFEYQSDTEKRLLEAAALANK